MLFFNAEARAKRQKRRDGKRTVKCVHAFESRYTEYSVHPDLVKEICARFSKSSWEVKDVLQKAKSKHYEGEFCSKCGMFVNKAQTE